MQFYIAQIRFQHELSVPLQQNNPPNKSCSVEIIVIVVSPFRVLTPKIFLEKIIFIINIRIEVFNSNQKQFTR